MIVRIVLLFFALFLYEVGWTKVIITGKIVGYDGKSIVYYHPTIEGIYTPYWKEIKPAGNGFFKIEFENEGYGNTKITYKNLLYKFFHNTNSKIYFEVKEFNSEKIQKVAATKWFLLADSLKQAMTIKIGGDYEAINKFYNKNLRSSYSTTRMVDGNYYSKLIYDSKSPTEAMALLDSLEQIEINQIINLPKQISIETSDTKDSESAVQSFLVNEVHAFYGAIFLNAMFLKRKDQAIAVIMDSTSKPNLYNRDWELLIERLGEQAKSNILSTPNSSDYLDFMESLAYTLDNYKQYDFPQNPTRSLDVEITDRLFNYDTSLFRDSMVKFAYELSGIQRFLNDQLFYSPVLLHAIYDLQAKHPNSKHFDFYKGNIEKLRSSLELTNQKFEKAKFVKGNYDTFDELLSRFKGKNLLLDIWATWCHPCIEDFRHKTKIQPFIDNEKIEVLYISIDKSQWDDRWRQSININKLEGYHYRANKEFIEDMWLKIGDFVGAIPRYVLIDREGLIFRSTAARPGDGDELIHQIESLVTAEKR